VRIGVAGHLEAALPDELADSRPRNSAQVQERDPPVPEVVRTEQRDTSSPAGLRDRGAKRIGARAGEETRVRGAILARAELAFESLRERGVELDPKRPARLRRRGAEAHPPTRLVVVKDARQVDRGDAGARPVEEQKRQPMLRRQQPIDGLEVGRRSAG
jgi:hypothetical protein